MALAWSKCAQCCIQLTPSALVCFYNFHFQLTFALLLVALTFFKLDPSAVDFAIVETRKGSDESGLLSVLSETLNVRFNSFSAFIRVLALYCRDSGQVPLLGRTVVRRLRTGQKDRLQECSRCPCFPHQWL